MVICAERNPSRNSPERVCVPVSAAKPRQRFPRGRHRARATTAIRMWRRWSSHRLLFRVGCCGYCSNRRRSQQRRQGRQGLGRNRRPLSQNTQNDCAGGEKNTTTSFLSFKDDSEEITKTNGTMMTNPLRRVSLVMLESSILSLLFALHSRQRHDLHFSFIRFRRRLLFCVVLFVLLFVAKDVRRIKLFVNKHLL
jgi:hypothetical protein